MEKQKLLEVWMKLFQKLQEEANLRVVYDEEKVRAYIEELTKEGFPCFR